MTDDGEADSDYDGTLSAIEVVRAMATSDTGQITGAFNRQLRHLVANYGERRAGQQLLISLARLALGQVAIVAESKDMMVHEYLDLLALDEIEERDT
jgi:hypothetical protein